MRARSGGIGSVRAVPGLPLGAARCAQPAGRAAAGAALGSARGLSHRPAPGRAVQRSPKSLTGVAAPCAHPVLQTAALLSERGSGIQIFRLILHTEGYFRLSSFISSLLVHRLT